MKKILIFNDISGLGNCSMAANLPIFCKLGHYCMPVVTGCYSCQTGFANYAVTHNPNTVDFAKRIAQNATPQAFYVGFCGNNAALQGVNEVVRDVLPEGCYLFVDPIMGDNGKLYPVFDDQYVAAMQSVVRNADCISPNLTEACLLANVDYNQLTSHKNETNYVERCKNVFASFLNVTGAKSAVITGVETDGQIANIVIESSGVKSVATKRVNVSFSGTGDVFSSVLLGLLLNGETLYSACKIAANFVADSAAQTERNDKRLGIDFCKLLHTLQ